MRKTWLSVLGLLIGSVAIISIVTYAGIKVFGNDGIVKQYKDTDTEFNKTEVVEKLNMIIKEKYFGDYKYAQENHQNIDEIYTEEKLFKYLEDSKYIEELKDINDNIVADQYYILAENLKSDIVSNEINANGSEGNGTKVFKVKKMDTKYMIYFVDKYGEEEELGELVTRPEI